MSGDLARRVLAAIRRFELIGPGERVLVGVSGGADSLALLCVLHDLAETLQISLCVAHLEHGLRGEPSIADARRVEQIARDLGWPSVIEHARVAELAAVRRLSLETAGREARYAFFERRARERGCACVATGHTADDRVESLLLNLLRGTGLDGLRSIPRHRRLSEGIRVVRPLLDVPHAEAVEYCAGRGIQPIEDPSNWSPEFARNRVRHALLPALEAEARPGLRRRLLALAEQIEEEVDLLEERAEELLQAARREAGRDRLVLAAEPLEAASPALARRALRRALADLGTPIGYEATATLLRLAVGDLATGITLPGGRVRATRRGSEVWLEVDAGKPPQPPNNGGSWTAERPGSPHYWGAGGAAPCSSTGFVGSATSGAAAGAERLTPPLPIPGRIETVGHCFEATLVRVPERPDGDPGRWVLLDADKLHGPLRVRTPREGDRVRPLGMWGRRKLHDLFVDAKLPRARRAAVPVVVDDEKVVWIVGFCLSEEVRLDAGSRRVVRLEARPSPLPSTDQAIASDSMV